MVTVNIKYLKYGSTRDEVVYIPKNIDNAREQNLGTWQDVGFECVKHQSNVTDWEKGLIEYRQELADWALLATGADCTLSVENFKRSSDPTSNLTPIYNAHCDFKKTYLAEIKEFASIIRFNTLPPDIRKAHKESFDINTSLSSFRTFLILQFWRNIGDINPDCQMAWCDNNTITHKCLVSASLDRQENSIHQGYGGENSIEHSVTVLQSNDTNDHKWYYYPELQHDEMVVFKAYDSSALFGNKWLSPHAAFNHPDITIGNPYRHSVEGRVFCLFF